MTLDREFCYAECRYAECLHAECRYIKSGGARLLALPTNIRQGREIRSSLFWVTKEAILFRLTAAVNVIKTFFSWPLKERILFGFYNFFGLV